MNCNPRVNDKARFGFSGSTKEIFNRAFSKSLLNLQNAGHVSVTE